MLLVEYVSKVWYISSFGHAKAANFIYTLRHYQNRIKGSGHDIYKTCSFTNSLHTSTCVYNFSLTCFLILSNFYHVTFWAHMTWFFFFIFAFFLILAYVFKMIEVSVWQLKRLYPCGIVEWLKHTYKGRWRLEVMKALKIRMLKAI